MQGEKSQIKEEHAIQFEHTDTYKRFTQGLNRIWEDAICSSRGFEQISKDSSKSILEGTLEGHSETSLSEDYQDLLETIGKDTEVLKLYTVSGITMAAEFGRKQGIPLECLADVKRKSFLRLAKATNYEEIQDVGIDVLKELRKCYVRYCMKEYSHLIRRAIETIHEKRFERISAGAVADIIGTDRAYLSKRFRQETGYTLTEYILRVKMDTAAELIEGNDYSLGEISEMLGYADYSYFSKLFKKQKKIPPEQWQ